jgi:uncharacterized protein YegL
MTNPDYTAIMLLVDRSGSMHSIQTDAEGGVNTFIANQAKAEDRRTIRIAQFNHDYHLIQSSIEAKDSPTFRLWPSGNTALLDAMGRAITEFGEELAALPEDERPGTVILAVMTDGMENWSQEYSWDAIKTMVTHQEKNYGWQVIYLGANQDAIETGRRIGVRTDRSMSYTASGIGTQSVLDSMDTYVTAAAAGAPAAFTEAQRSAAMKEDDDANQD